MTLADPGIQVLLVEDEESTRQLHGAILVGAGCSVEEVATLAGLREKIAHSRFDIILLDLRLSDGNTLELVSEIRRVTSAGIIIATASPATEDRLKGLEQGADEYLQKPVHPRELVARVRNLAARLAATPRDAHAELVHHFEGWSVDLAARAVKFHNGESIHLTENEFRLLNLLIRNPSKPVHRERLLTMLDSDEGATERAVDKAIYRLRVKIHAILGGASPLIETVHGFGYKFVARRL